MLIQKKCNICGEIFEGVQFGWDSCEKCFKKGKCRSCKTIFNNVSKVTCDRFSLCPACFKKFHGKK